MIKALIGRITPKASNMYRKEKDFTNQDLSAYVFDGTDFSNADFSGAKMKSFSCNNCNMTGESL